MAKLGNQMKLALLKGMEAIGKGASNLASNAHLKVSEMNLETRRREILSEFPLRAHDLWQKGVELPAPLGDMMSELNDLDERLSVLRAQRYAKVEGGEDASQPVAETEETQQPSTEEAEAVADEPTDAEAAPEAASCPAEPMDEVAQPTDVVAQPTSEQAPAEVSPASDSGEGDERPEDDQ